MMISPKLKVLAIVNFKSLFFFLFFTSFCCFSQQEGSSVDDVDEDVADSIVIAKYEMIPADSILQDQYTTDNAIDVKKFDPNFRKKYKDKDFDYSEITPHDGIWDRIKRRISKILEAVFGKINPSKANSLTEIVLKFFAIIIVGFILYFITKYMISNNGNLFFSKKNKKVNIPNKDIIENIHEINFVETISEFERTYNYRAAIRYQFLKTLKTLNDKKVIAWNPEKTNQEYIKELKNSTQKQSFKDLAYIFDHVWYGEFEVNESDYQCFKSNFEQAKF